VGANLLGTLARRCGIIVARRSTWRHYSVGRGALTSGSHSARHRCAVGSTRRLLPDAEWSRQHALLAGGGVPCSYSSTSTKPYEPETSSGCVRDRLAFAHLKCTHSGFSNHEGLTDTPPPTTLSRRQR
jgi:hypothetical protein